MAKLIELNEAATMLGVTPEELNEMRSRSEIFGYRDGTSWKFKLEEIERVAEERGGMVGANDYGLADDDDELRDATLNVSREEFFGKADDDDSSVDQLDSSLDDLDSDLEDHSESILVSEEALGSSERNTSSTIIGKTDDGLSPGDSDLRLAESGKAASPAESSDIQIGERAAKSGSSSEMSDLNLADDDEDELSLSPGSDINSTSDIGLGSTAESGIGLSSGSDVDLDSSDLGLAGSSILGGGSGKASGSDLSLDEDDDDALELARDGDDDLELGEDLSLEGSGLVLDDDDGDLVLDGGSDLSLAGDSGINLMPADSGISLEDEPMELSGSGVSSLELPEDDDDFEDQVISLEEEADPDEATMVKGDNDFMLTPVDEGDDDPSDSGSQVIALDTEELDAEAATQLGMSAGNALLLDEDEAEAGPYQAEPVAAGAPATAYAAAGMVPAEPPETPYSIWQVMSLFIVVLLLAVSGMLMMDVIRNMWSFDQPYAANTSIMEMILDAVGKSK